MKKIIPACLLILLSVLLVVFNVLSKANRKSVADVSNEFLRAWRVADYSIAYALMTDHYRSGHSMEAFTNGVMIGFASIAPAGPGEWEVDPDAHVEVRGRSQAFVSKQGSLCLGRRYVFGTCYELVNGSEGWRFTGKAVIIQD